MSLFYKIPAGHCLLTGLVVCALLWGCASTSPGDGQPVAADESAAVPAPAPAPDQTEDDNPDAPPIDETVMYNVLAAEWLGGEEETRAAVEHYLEAALSSSDPAIAERATRVAVGAQYWDYAALAAERWLQLQPRSEEAHRHAILTALGLADSAAATRHLESLLDLYRDDPEEAWRILASVLPQLPDQERAAETLATVLGGGRFADSPSALQAQSRLAAQLNDLPQARALTARALAAESDNRDLHIWAGQLAVAEEDYDAALQHYQAARDIEPDRDINLAIAELHKRAGDLSRAQAVLADLEQDAGVLFTRIAYAVEAEQQTLGRRHMDSLLALEQSADEPFGGDDAFFAAQAAELLEMPQQAITWYGQVQDGPRRDDALLRRALLLGDTGEVDAAVASLEPLAASDEGTLVEEAYLTRAQILMDAGREDAARQTLSMGLTRVAESISLRYMRGLLYAADRNVAAAEADFRVILATDPDNVDALNALGYTLADMTDRHEEALELIEAAYRQRPDDAAIIDSMGWVLYRLGRLQESAALLKQAWEAGNNAEIAAHLGEVLWALGDKEGARAAWSEGYALDPEDGVLQETLERHGVVL